MCKYSVLLLSLFLSACTTSDPAPVVNAWQQPQASSTYRVQAGDTIYSIAWGFGLDYRALAAANDLPSPYRLHPGQILVMRTASPTAVNSEAEMPRVIAPSQPESVVRESAPEMTAPPEESYPVASSSTWRWPARGKVINHFSRKLAGNQGIDIAGKVGQPIVASASGEVVYSGDGVRGYGNLILIKHNNSYLSAYAHNQVNLVRVGQRVKSGQRIARMGRNDAGKVLLHFEIRYNGRPVNPLGRLGG